MARKPADSLLAARRGSDTTWHGTAFVVEALVLLVFLAFALAVFMQLFGAAHNRGVEERQLTQAVLLASNAAEEFAAAPLAGTSSEAFGGDGGTLGSETGTGADAEDAYIVSREVLPERTEGGTLYRANITVSCGGEAVYELETSRYVSDGAAGTDIGRAPDAAAAEGGDVA